MKPRICYKHTYLNTSRYTLLYPDTEAYKNWMWTSFDSSLQKKIEETLNGFTVVSHINQPVQSNGKTFIKNIKSIFDDEDLLVKEIDENKNINCISRLSNIFSPTRDESLFYIAMLNDKNRNCFFGFRDFGCFWYVFILKNKSYLESFISSINRKTINKDSFFSGNKEIPCVFYRDYLNNSISIISNNESISDHIEEYINNEKIMIYNKEIKNIFDNTYIEGIYSSDMRE